MVYFVHKIPYSVTNGYRIAGFVAPRLQKGLMGLIKEKTECFLPSLNNGQEDLLAAYLDILLQGNKQFNLTAIDNYEDAVVKHIADSLAAAPFIMPNAVMLDIGSGGGCPAIPLKIVHPNLQVTLIDSVGKKVDFLNKAISALALKGAVAIKTRAEELCRTDKRESFDVVTARAVAALPVLLELASPLLKVGGLFIAYKGDNKEEFASAKTAAQLLNCKLTTPYDYILDNQYARTVLIYQKTAPIAHIYPRPYAKIQKYPL